MTHDRRLSGGAVPGITRRTFIGAGLAGSAALLSGRFDSPASARLSAAASPAGNFVEQTIPALQELLSSGATSSRELTLGHIDRIAGLNPILRAVIEINPSAVAMALGSTPSAGRGACADRSTASPSS